MSKLIKIIPETNGFLVTTEISEGKHVTEKVTKDEVLKMRDIFTQALKTGETVIRQEDEKKQIIATLDDLAEFKENEIKEIKNKIELLKKDISFTKDLASNLGSQKQSVADAMSKGIKDSVDHMTKLLESVELSKEQFLNTIESEHEYLAKKAQEIDNKIAQGLTEEQELSILKTDMERSKGLLDVFKKSVQNKADALFKEFEELRKAHNIKQETVEKKVDTIIDEAKKVIDNIQQDMETIKEEQKEIIERNKKEVVRERLVIAELKKKEEIDNVKMLTVKSKLNKLNEAIEKEILRIKIEDETERLRIQEKFQQALDLIGNKPDILSAQMAKLNALAEQYQNDLTKFSARSGKTKEEMLQEAINNLEQLHFFKKLTRKVRGK